MASRQMSLYQPDILKSLWLESDHLLPTDTAQFKGSPTSTGFDLTEHYSSLSMMEQRNKKSLQWKQQRGMAGKEVQTLRHQRWTSHWQTQSTSSLCVPVLCLPPCHIHVCHQVLAGSSSTTAILHHLLMWPLSSISLSLFWL